MLFTIKKQLSVTYRLIVVVSIIFLLPKFNIKAQTVDAHFYYAPFYKLGTGTYIETYISLNSKSLHYKLNSNNLLESSVEVTMLFKNIDKIKEFRRFNIVSPQLPDTTVLFPNFIDLQHITIPEGVYNFDLIIRDNYAFDSIDNYYHSQLITVNIPNNEMTFSGIELIESKTEVKHDNIYVRDGIEYIPYISNTYPAKVNKLMFYAELYFAAKDIGPLEDYMLTSHIEYTNTSKPMKEFSTYQVDKAYNTNIIFNEIDIKDLPTGNYYLVVKVNDMKGNTLLSKKKRFRREGFVSRPKAINVNNTNIENTFASQIANRDTLIFYANALKPICDSSEINFIDKELQLADIKLIQQFFYNFWESRNINNSDSAWFNYKMKLNFVEQKYKTDKTKGYKTQRGRIYLQYGSPNSISKKYNNKLSSHCEVWHYYKTNNLDVTKFEFCNNVDE